MAEEGTDFDAPVPANPAVASGPLDHEIVVDDECYMGKEGQLDECADFGKCRSQIRLVTIGLCLCCLFSLVINF